MNKIAWTNETWNPVIGCSKCSPGCLNCYAEKMAARLAAMLPKTCGEDSQHLAAAYANVIESGGWSGKVEFIPDALEKPLHWKKPRRIFVCSMGDLFYESVPFAWIDKVINVTENAPQHTYQILTKRPERMAEYSRHIGGFDKFPNIMIGVTAENQAMADKRIPILLNIPVAKRFLSIEPMMEAIRLEKWWVDIEPYTDLSGWRPRLDWVIVGCESGPGRRECKIEWMQSIVEQCREAGVKCFVKQVSIGGKVSHNPDEWPESLRIREFPEEAK